jgi:hypothetical protein
MLAVLAMAAILTTQVVPDPHVRTTEPKLAALIELGLTGSGTFRQLVEQLNASDIVVYVVLKQDRDGLGAYLSHDIVSAGGRRFLRVAIDTLGTESLVVARLGHELQHALEVAQAPEVRDAASLEQLFTRLDIRSVCVGCYETAAALQVQAAVEAELGAKARQRKR